MQSIIFLLMLLAFIIGTPLFPMHLWLADANAEASTQCTMLLSGIMTKFSGYGMLLLFTMLSISSRYSIYVAVLASFSVLYYAFVLIRQTDIKRIASYSSAIGMGIVVLGICTLNNFGVYGAAYAMLAHGLGVALLFLVAGCMKHIFGERDIRAIGGAVLNARLTAYAFIVGILAVIGFPLTAGFVAEILVFVGAIHAFGSIIVIPLLGIVLAGAYLYSVANRAMFSTKEPSSVVDSIGKAQFLGYALLISFIFLFGLMPSVILNLVGL
jgi:NADH-quinone oxidoreductase subunit M